MLTTTKWIVAAVAAVAVTGFAYAEDLSPKNRVELKRADLSAPGANMEVVLSVTEYQPGDFIARHIHHGEEAFYVIQGATLETPDGKQIELKTGTGSINMRDMPHARRIQGRRQQSLQNRNRARRGQRQTALRRAADTISRCSLSCRSSL
jgi:quercetin dioxygenase-like cupin family protein